MSFDLRRGQDSRSFPGWEWGAVLRFAIDNGWRPAGTLPREYGQIDDVQSAEAEGNSASWRGVYGINDGQEVTETDARALGEALLRGVAAAEALEQEKPTKWPDDSFRRVKKFADFALKGSFYIW